MNRAHIIIEMLRERSIELQVKFDALLSGYVTEQLALRIAKCDKEHNFLLKNGHDLELSAYKREVYGKLVYAYSRNSDDDFFDEALLFFEHQMDWEADRDIRFHYEMEKQQYRMVIKLLAVIGDHKIPAAIQIEPADCKKMPQEKSMRLIMENSRSEKIFLYPYETQIYEDYFELLEKLSLLQDMSVLQRIYEGLEHAMFEGRSVSKNLTKLEEEHHLQLDERRYHQFLSCVENPYLRKRWRAYKKKKSLVKPDYEELMSRLISFLKPVWEERLSGMVYLGSWLPELGRYLD